MRVAWLLAVALASATASATPAEPTGKHPRMLLDPELRAAWKAQASAGGPVTSSIKLCDEARTGTTHDDSQYQGSEWAKTLQACLVAWAATDKLEHQATALRFFRALLDDEQQIGDHKGGDDSGKHDRGYAIRNRAPYAALAYDWLHDAPGMTPELRQHARERWKVWLDWYAKDGYHPRDAGTNYQAGYLIAATIVAIAQGGEAAEQGGPALWKLVADDLWAKDMAGVFASGGLLDGGDWPEGWQYGPLSVAEYALGARVAKQNGIAVDGITPWLAGTLRRYIYALTPNDQLWAGGDAEAEQAYMEPNLLGLQAVALGDASADDKTWARGELARLKLTDTYGLLYGALAAVGPAAAPPRATWPTWYRTAGTSELFARTRWDDRAIWFVAECSRTLDVDHRHPDAGNFALSRGKDDVVIDPTPYGSMSTLTGNAPTVLSPHLPGPYQPSQAFWSEKTHWAWTTQTHGGVVAARCDYADAFKFQERKSDIAEAVRDFVLLPSSDGTDAVLVVIDRADTGDAANKMYLRFRIPGELALDKTGTATATIGGTRLAIHGESSPALGKPRNTDCFKDGIDRGKCDAARVAVTDYRVELAGPTPRAVHVIAATGAKAPDASTKLGGDGWAGLHVTNPRDAIVVWPTKPAPGGFTYRAPKGASVTHVVLDGAGVAARADGDTCAVTVTGGTATQPTIVVIDRACAVTADPDAPNAGSALGTKPAAVQGSTANRRSGCCDASATPSAILVPLALIAIVLIARRRHRAV